MHKKGKNRWHYEETLYLIRITTVLSAGPTSINAGGIVQKKNALAMLLKIVKVAAKKINTPANLVVLAIFSIIKGLPHIYMKRRPNLNVEMQFALGECFFQMDAIGVALPTL